MKKIKILSILLVATLLILAFPMSASAKKLPLNVQYKWNTKGLKVTWTKVSKATHYNVKISRYTNANKKLTVKKITSDSYTIGFKEFKDLGMNKVYNIAVAAYKGNKKLGTVKVTTRDIEIIGHRGAMDKAPENTLASLKKAAELNYDSLEADFFVTDSGDILIFHDIYLNKCGAPNLNIRSLTNKTLKNYPIISAKNVGLCETQYIPTLAQYAKAASENNLKLYLHMKYRNQENASAKALQKIANTLKKYNMLKKTVVFSAEKKVCKLIAQSECTAGYLRVPHSIQDAKDSVKFAKSVNAKYVICQYNEYLAKSVITLAHKNNLKIGYYRVSDKKLSAQVYNRGADFIITDKDFIHE